jgi:hypothetical protein
MAASTPPSDSFLTQLFTKGEYTFEKDGMGWIVLSIITWLPGIGQLGLNHIMIDQPVVALLKVLSLPMSYLFMVVLSPYLPLDLQGQWMFVVAALGPWYLFDIIQTITNKNTGFFSLIDMELFPLNTKEKGGAANGVWKLTPTKLNMILGTMAGCGQIVSYLFPGSSGVIVGNIISGIGASLLVIVGAASYLSGAKKVAGMMQGGMIQGGEALPPLSQIIDTLPKQSGGASSSKKEGESTLFLYGLGLVAVSGLALGLIRK